MKTEKELEKLLKQVSDSYEDFVFYILHELETETQKKDMISCLKANPQLDTSTILEHLHEFNGDVPEPFEPIGR